MSCEPKSGEPADIPDGSRYIRMRACPCGVIFWSDECPLCRVEAALRLDTEVPDEA